MGLWTIAPKVPRISRDPDSDYPKRCFSPFGQTTNYIKEQIRKKGVKSEFTLPPKRKASRMVQIHLFLSYNAPEFSSFARLPPLFFTLVPSSSKNRRNGSRSTVCNQYTPPSAIQLTAPRRKGTSSTVRIAAGDDAVRSVIRNSGRRKGFRETILARSGRSRKSRDRRSFTAQGGSGAVHT